MLGWVEGKWERCMGNGRLESVLVVVPLEKVLLGSVWSVERVVLVAG